MRKFALFLLLLPQLASAQTNYLAPKATPMEISFNIGYAPDNAYKQEPWRGGFIRSALSLLKTSGRLQYGVSLEGGTNSDDHWYITPGLIANHMFPTRRNYLYAGGMAGYVCSGNMIPVRESGLIHGYVMGVQGGIVHPLNKRLSLSTELAVRSTQVWQRPFETEGGTETDFILYFPVTIGLRYRL